VTGAALLRRASQRHVQRHPWQFGLAVLGIALGVAVAVSIDLANGSARRAFALATEAVTGRATHQVVGGPAGLPEAVYRAIRLGAEVSRAAPIVSSDVAAPDHPGRVFHVLGVDPLAEAPFRPYAAGRDPTAGGRIGELAALLTRPGAVLAPRETARALGLDLGGTLRLRAGGVTRPVVIAGWLEPGDGLARQVLDHLLVADIATAQELLGAEGRLSRIDLILPDGVEGDRARERVARALPPGAEIVAAGARAEAAARLTRAFSLNLTALSLLALVVGMFLIYNTMTFSVVQRRPLIATLRALGVSRGEVFAMVAAEALVIGLVGTALGLALGVGLARVLLGLVTRTINDLYFVLAVREVAIAPQALAVGALLGVGATLLAALAPALEAAGGRPRAAMLRSELEQRARRVTPWAALGGLAVLAFGAGLMAAPGAAPGVGWGFAGLFTVVLGTALLAPAALVLLLRPIDLVARRSLGIAGRLATRGVGAALSRTGVAIAALMVAVSATVGVGLMIASFRSAVTAWLEGTLRADVYVAPPSLIGNRPDSALDPALAARLAATPGVAAASTTRAAVASSPAGPVNVVALGLAAGRRPGFRFRDGDAAAIWAAFDAGGVLASEPLAYQRGLGPGAAIRLRTDRGEREFRVAGVFRDYGSAAGVVAMSRATYDAHWDDRAISGLALEALPGQPVEALVAALRGRAGGEEAVIRSSRALREASLAIFDRTFAITGVLRLAIVVVAFIGVLSALLAWQLERAREIGVLRALGCSPAEIGRMVVIQTGLMGLLAGVLALPVGVALAAALIFVINRRSFGWTMPLDVSPAVLAEGLGLAVGAALLAGLYPARRMARASPAEALREE